MQFHPSISNSTIPLFYFKTTSVVLSIFSEGAIKETDFELFYNVSKI